MMATHSHGSLGRIRAAPVAVQVRKALVRSPVVAAVPVAVAPRRTSGLPLAAICCLGLILLLIASTIVLALIPIYLQRRGTESSIASVPYNTRYRLNNGFLPVGALSASNCQVVQSDQRNFAAANRFVAPSVPTIIACTVQGVNTTTGSRRRRQAAAVGNVLSLDGLLTGTTNCRRGSCLLRRAQKFLQALRERGTFFLTFTLADGTSFTFSVNVISATITGPEIIGTPSSGIGTGTLGSGTGSGTSSGTGSGTGSGSTTNPTTLSSAQLNDILILNYALTLELLEATFYTIYQANFTAANFIAAGFPQPIYDYFNIIMSHEQAHVRALTAVIQQLGGTPVAACTYNFSMVVDVATYVAVARALENTGTMAYTGALAGFDSLALTQAAATIATVEARHAAFLNYIEGVSPFPLAFENATAPSVIAAAIKPFLVSCPQQLVLPTIPYAAAVSFNGTVPTSNNSNVVAYTNAIYLNDINALNFALVTEHLESTYYNIYVNAYSSSDFTNAGFPDVLALFIVIREIEQAHVDFLTMTITQRGATPVPYCVYNFTINNVTTFVQTSQLFETTGQRAYDGAARTLTDPGLIMGAGTLATVEGRFASFLNDILGQVPFPDAFDQTLTPAQVIVALSPYQTCNFTLTLPVDSPVKSP